MNAKRILILGGYGSTGLPLARLLLQETQDVELLLAGRTLSKARAAAENLNQQYGGERVRAVFADAADSQSLDNAFQDVDLVVVASSTAAYTRQVASAAIRAGCDYLDAPFSSEKLSVLRSMEGEVHAAGLCFISEGGFHPGLPAAMVRFIAPEFDEVHSANIFSVIKIDWKSLHLGQSTLDEFVGEFKDFQTQHYKDGRWQSGGWRAMMLPRYVDFAPPFGRQYVMPMFMEEMRSLPQIYPTLQETGFFVGGFNWFVDWLLSPLLMLTLRIFPRRGIRSAGRWMLWGLQTFSKAPYGTLLKLEARGVKDGAPKALQMTIRHPDGYTLTAAPMAACLLQWLGGTLRKPGLWLQAHAVEPRRFMADLQRMGVQIEVQELAR